MVNDFPLQASGPGIPEVRLAQIKRADDLPGNKGSALKIATLTALSLCKFVVVLGI